jgi:hypothetical protein
MFAKTVRYLKHLRAMQRISISLSRGNLTSSTRSIDLTDPKSWEFSAFSQNGEDGIIDVLTSKIKNPNRYFIEIGSSDGLENNTSYLAVAKKYSGLMIEAGKKASDDCDMNIASLCTKDFVKCIHKFITKENIKEIKDIALYSDPDVFSLDIDSYDYYIAKEIMEIGFRPKIFAVEYNSAFGSEQSLTVDFVTDFNNVTAQTEGLYYGVSIAGWKVFFKKWGYEFISVDMNGVNAFFVNSAEFDKDFLQNIKGIDFAENILQRIRFKSTWEEQFKRIKPMKLVNIH